MPFITPEVTFLEMIVMIDIEVFLLVSKSNFER